MLLLPWSVEITPYRVLFIWIHSTSSVAEYTATDVVVQSRENIESIIWVLWVFSFINVNRYIFIFTIINNKYIKINDA